MDSSRKTVKSMLKNIHSIVVPDEWVESCIDWIFEEQPRKNFAADELRQLVFEQWLVTDMKDLNSSVLPQSLNQSKMKLNGNFCLQINYILDVGQPFFQQIIKLKGTENENVNTDDQVPQTQQFKSSRMIWIELTDGCKVTKACEYKPIPCLNTNILPGAKVLIKGPVECRRNIMLLRPENVELLGGFVEDLLESNKQENMMVKSLGCEVDENSIKCWTKSSKSNDICQRNRTNNKINATNQSSNAHHSRTNVQNVNDFDVDPEELALIMDEDF